MATVILFIVVLISTFLAVWFVLKPTRREQALDDRLSDIGRTPEGVVDETPDLIRRENLSDIALVEVLLRRFKPAANLQKLLSQADLDWTVGRVIAGTLVALIIVPVIVSFFLPNLVIEMVAGVAAASAIYIYIFVKRSFRFSRFNELLPEAIDLITRALRAGHSINASIEMVSREVPNPVGIEFRRTFEEQNFGLPMREAMTNLATRVPIPDLQFLVTAILVQKETGGNLVEILEKTATVLRERLRLKGQLAIYTAQGRLTGWILAGMPFFIFLGMSFINPKYARILIEEPLGRTLIYVGLGLMLIGGYIIRKMFGGSDEDADVTKRLSLAGFREPVHAEIYYGVRLLAPVAGALIAAFFIKSSTVFWFFALGTLGFFGPELWLSQAISNRREQIRLSLPDALDLLVICMEAGLGMDQALIRVGQELRISHPKLSDELLLINLEQRAGKPRVEAWKNFADRSGLEVVRAFVNMLVQTERFGTPISRSLGHFADALRLKRRQQAEEQAAKTTIKMIFPLVLFIFPSMFIVLLAPAIIMIGKSFSEMFK